MDDPGNAHELLAESVTVPDPQFPAPVAVNTEVKMDTVILFEVAVDAVWQALLAVITTLTTSPFTKLGLA
jgi:hypothetical protein